MAAKPVNGSCCCVGARLDLARGLRALVLGGAVPPPPFSSGAVPAPRVLVAEDAAAPGARGRVEYCAIAALLLD